MTAIDAVQEPYVPDFQPQGPDDNCVIDGKQLGWDSCTAYATAMELVDRPTRGTYQPSGCHIRRLTDPLDTVGGLTLNQTAKVVRDRYGIAVSVFVGSNVVDGAYLARQIRAGRPAVVQGNAAAMVGTKWQSTAGDVNHAIGVNHVRGGTLESPKEALVFDPAADGRPRSYHVDQGPSWWPWSLVLKFAAYLRPNGPGDNRIGPGHIYCAIGPDTEPHVTLVKGATVASPFPDRVRAAKSPTAIHSTRGDASTTKRWVKRGTLLRLYQYVGVWGGNDDGSEWVLLRNTTHVGGAT